MQRIHASIIYMQIVPTQNLHESTWIKWIRDEINVVNGNSVGSTEDKLLDLGDVDYDNEFGNADDNNELGNPFDDNINNNDSEKNVTNEDGDKDGNTNDTPHKARSTLSNFSNLY